MVCKSKYFHKLLFKKFCGVFFDLRASLTPVTFALSPPPHFAASTLCASPSPCLVRGHWGWLWGHWEQPWGHWLGTQLCGFLSPLPARRYFPLRSVREPCGWMSALPGWGWVHGRDESASAFGDGDAIWSSSQDLFFPAHLCSFCSQTPHSCDLHGVYLPPRSPALWLGKPRKPPHSAKVPVRG